ncbi:MAG: glutamine--fructose-6-phosphate transaminase (isomerizing) [Clostridium sp.]|jgi:glucosamine--fructose-6-phosphate aminotransferase (isomerizing)|uniref:glutamine--fructose-6-phosphate transaminase (isomerizing) n=1 Tax=Clostridium sp. TaxID=1506 RepID=UPI0025B814C6|nr:glutamine--fructose-6-phosphate transaminase (isomerizing) [Clostridium sp.]MCH3965725.1 glutamine--fructose-6-phosphate transaminase (isomerizing) [Clostridium sp.]MCI1717101.1 glutamine--fructose-6-phosphate transaminase (isomerizing) [Clostridium sp.]MCI1801362.1 glutamine--fructose-6-phosphate transaminase (isomerizing) [Clostridium sp.]MCI1815208.1 glutamine--fructose-6-phosphate transaminase (isomerizing) [Clostridium sp.]MCI1872111.1 glutamine--fructose-6-phosphate transaminase (isom
MCGIVGFVGNENATPILVNGLSKLEYRGYDSAGVAVIDNDHINVTKCKGRLSNLEGKLKDKPLKGYIGIGHTRWATHGEPSDVNAHPHSNGDGTISVVHNGIIENYVELRQMLKSKGYKFVSDTDTEVIPQLVDYFYHGDLTDAVMKAVSRLKGSYAIGVISSREPDKIVAARKDSPLVVGTGNNEYFIASDIPAILNYTRDVYLLNDNEFVVLDKTGVKILDGSKNQINRDIFHVTWNADAAEKGGYDHFMIKEIHEQPKAIKDTMTSRIMPGKPVTLDNIKLTKEQIDDIDKIYIVACGTAYHAGIIGKYAIEKLAKMSVEVDVASEFRYRDPIIDNRTLMIIVSQSGETADTLAALREGKEKGARVIAVTNVVGSTISREAEDVLYTWAGPEIAVASTKAYVTQLIVMYTLALFLAQNKGTLNEEEIEELKSEMLTLPEKAEKVLKNENIVEDFAAGNYTHRDMFYIGRGLDYAVAMEGSLKVKEVSYIHSEAYAGGELKHGPIALIENGTIVVAGATQQKLVEKMISNIKELTTRGAKVLGLAIEGSKDVEDSVDSIIYLPKIMDVFAPVLEVIPLQLLGYYMAIKKGCDVDKPRNLAKSVTVE